ncbi:MAG: hypothetical protein H0U45_16215 [Tatlockia sp.]|nr:hypothetical protein [Tatlockia sp.]
MPQAIVILIMAGTIIACTTVTLGAIAPLRNAMSDRTLKVQTIFKT